MALVPSVDSISAFEFLHDFMKLLIFYLSPSKAVLAMGSRQGTVTLDESSQRKIKLKSYVPFSLSTWDPVGTADLEYRELF